MLVFLIQLEIVDGIIWGIDMDWGMGIIQTEHKTKPPRNQQENLKHTTIQAILISYKIIPLNLYYKRNTTKKSNFLIIRLKNLSYSQTQKFLHKPINKTKPPANQELIFEII